MGLVHPLRGMFSAAFSRVLAPVVWYCPRGTFHGYCCYPWRDGCGHLCDSWHLASWPWGWVAGSFFALSLLGWCLSTWCTCRWLYVSVCVVLVQLEAPSHPAPWSCFVFSWCPPAWSNAAESLWLGSVYLGDVLLFCTTNVMGVCVVLCLDLVYIVCLSCAHYYYHYNCRKTKHRTCFLA